MANVYQIEGTNPFRVPHGSVLRIGAGGIAGATAEAKVSGSAKLRGQNSVMRIVNGQMPMGASGIEFEIETTGNGDAQVAITVKNPTSPTPETKEYKFTVT